MPSLEVKVRSRYLDTKCSSWKTKFKTKGEKCKQIYFWKNIHLTKENNNKYTGQEKNMVDKNN